MIVRRVLPEDWEDMARMASDFAASNPHNVGFSPVAFRGLFDHAMTNDGLAMWIARISGNAAGMMGAISYPMFFNPSHQVAQELFWWVEPGYRNTVASKALMAQFEAWAVRNGPARLMLLAQENDRTEAVNRLYRTMGYMPLERAYYKDVA